MALESFTQKVLNEKYGLSGAMSRITQAFAETEMAIKSSLAPAVNAFAEALARSVGDRTCRLCGRRHGHHSGCPLED